MMPVALAEHVAGSEGVFVSMMNEKVAALGMTNTHFYSFWPNESHYSTARDIALWQRLITKHPNYYTKLNVTEVELWSDNTNHLIV